MKSLFLRLLVSLWIAMALLVGLFAVIHGWAFSAESSSLRRRLSTRSVELRAESALSCARDGLSGCEQRLAPLEPRDQRVAVYRSGALVSGEPIEGAPLVEERARRSADGIAVEVGERELVAVVLRRDPSFVAVATGPVRSPWMFFIVPETLPLRLLAIVVVTGLVAVFLARYLSRPIHILRGATQRMAAGDLSVRVARRLAGADGETLALGRDMDRMAERIEELLETQRRLLRDVSHELRSPLARLNISLELVRRRSPPDVEPAFDRIERETERLNGMIGELLTLSRLESARGMERPERFDLTALVEQLVDDAALEAEQQGCSVELGARDACSLDGNEELLRRAIENVVRNAVRFTEAGTTVRIDLSCSGGVAEVRVRDRGPGVPEAALGDIFKPFYRVDDHRARGAGGTGIGLAITQRAVLLHGGEVEARNAEGGGLEVALRLPVGAGA
ncbi:ATP-binding protein [Sorangium sp. So ce834]|uniref:sensor histidine kinase n=1 Tax=Sorangium sp. So ce834 TaxID=3133321 RepID=UPI003F605CF1